MTTLLVTFLTAFVISLVATPLARMFGTRIGAVDKPQSRKVHLTDIPRSGGIALFVSFFVTLCVSHLFYTEVSNKLIWDTKMISFVCGALLIFGVGLVDDCHRLSARTKVLFQIAAASIAFAGGIRIGGHVFWGAAYQYGWLSYFITVFWFLLIINAVNLIDGLDGLASGIVLFTSLVMVALLVIKGDVLTALYFASLGGAVLGFLRYNFNPASIFMGDGGSYFLGYAIAAISTMSSIKGQTGALILIPLIGMGVPVFDTILSPLRRFVVGASMFCPDRRHIHHRLLDLGLNTRKTVLIIYGISIVLCLSAIVIANSRDEMSGLFLILLVISSAIFFRKLRYFEYFTVDKVYGWLRDIVDVAGFNRSRRSFLGLQMEIENSRGPDEMWDKVCMALEMIRFNTARLDLNHKGKTVRFEWAPGNGNGHGVPNSDPAAAMKISIPLMNGGDENLGTLLLVKDLRQELLTSFTIRRVEHLRRAIQVATSRFEKKYA